MTLARTAKRLNDLEILTSEMDTEVLTAVGKSVRGLITHRDEVHQAEMVLAALSVIQGIMSSFTKEVRKEVAVVFMKRMEEMRIYGYDEAHHARHEHRQEVAPTLLDLLGIKDT